MFYMLDFQENARKEIEASVQVFTSVVESMKKTHKELTEEIEAKHDAEQRRFEELIKELRQEIDELERKSVELQQLSHIEDHITLLQVRAGMISSHLLCDCICLYSMLTTIA